MVQLWLHFCVDFFMYCMHHFGTDYTPYKTEKSGVNQIQSVVLMMSGN